MVFVFEHDSRSFPSLSCFGSEYALTDLMVAEVVGAFSGTTLLTHDIAFSSGRPGDMFISFNGVFLYASSAHAILSSSPTFSMMMRLEVLTAASARPLDYG